MWTQPHIFLCLLIFYGAISDTLYFIKFISPSTEVWGHYDINIDRVDHITYHNVYGHHYTRVQPQPTHASTGRFSPNSEHAREWKITNFQTVVHPTSWLISLGSERVSRSVGLQISSRWVRSRKRLRTTERLSAGDL